MHKIAIFFTIADELNEFDDFWIENLTDIKALDIIIDLLHHVYNVFL